MPAAYQEVAPFSRASVWLRLGVGLFAATVCMLALNALSFFVRSSGDPSSHGTHAFGCPLLIWQRGGIGGLVLFNPFGLMFAAACTTVWGLALGLFVGDDLLRFVHWLRLPPPTWRPITLKSLLLMQLSVALVAAAGATGVATVLVTPLVLLGPIGAWCVRRMTFDRGVPYATTLLLASAFACIALGAAAAPTGSVAEAVAWCFVSWTGQGAIYWLVNRRAPDERR